MITINLIFKMLLSMYFKMITLKPILCYDLFRVNGADDGLNFVALIINKTTNHPMLN